MKRYVHHGLVFLNGKLMAVLKAEFDDYEDVHIDANTKSINNIGYFYDQISDSKVQKSNDRNIEVAFLVRSDSLKAIDEQRAFKARREAKKKADIFDLSGLAELKKQYKKTGKVGRIKIIEFIKWHLDE